MTALPPGATAIWGFGLWWIALGALWTVVAARTLTGVRSGAIWAH